MSTSDLELSLRPSSSTLAFLFQSLSRLLNKHSILCLINRAMKKTEGPRTEIEHIKRRNNFTLLPNTHTRRTLALFFNSQMDKGF